MYVDENERKQTLIYVITYNNTRSGAVATKVLICILFLLVVHYSLKCTRILLLRFIFRPSNEFIIRSFLLRLFSLPLKAKMSFQNMSNLANPKAILDGERERTLKPNRSGKMKNNIL